MDLNKSLTSLTLITGLSMIAIGVYVPIMIDNFIETTIQQRFPFTNGSETTSKWSKPDIAIYTRFYIFNITNAEAYLSGEKPAFDEIGPYTFRQIRENRIYSWNEDETMFDFETFRTYHFVPSLSNGSINDPLTLINFPVIAVAKIIAEKVPMFKKTTGNIIKTHGGGIFLNVTVGQVLFEGFEVPFVTKLSSISRSLRALFPSKFGIMYGQNNSGNGVLNAFTGKDDIKKLLHINKWRGQRTVNCWADSRCGLINGTDGTWFHPMISPMEKLHVFNAEINRSLSLEHDGNTRVQGISAYHYVSSKELLDAPTNERSNDCFCNQNDTSLSESGFCSLDGVLDISQCHNGAPLVLSLPHFLYADPLLIHSSKGINPDLTKHQSYLDIEPLTGIVLAARRRIQFNLRIRYNYNLGGISLKDMVYPLLWLEEGADIPADKAAELNGKMFSKIIMAEVFSFTLVLVGVGLIVLSFFSFSWPYFSKNFIDKYKSTHSYVGLGSILKPTTSEMEDKSNKQLIKQNES